MYLSYNYINRLWWRCGWAKRPQ